MGPYNEYLTAGMQVNDVNIKLSIKARDSNFEVNIFQMTHLLCIKQYVLVFIDFKRYPSKYVNAK